MWYHKLIKSFVATDGDLLTKRVAVSSKIMHQLICGDALEVLKTLPDNSVQTCVTSPPYFGLRDYGHERQIGLEESPDAYVRSLVKVFSEVKRVLRNDGTLWLNLGDSYAGSGKGPAGNLGKKHDERNMEKKHSAIVPDGLKPKDLIGIPWRVAFALQQDGWYLRQDIIWHKPNPMPESVTDRCTKAHEYIFLLSKSKDYYFDHEAMKEPSTTPGRMTGGYAAKVGELKGFETRVRATYINPDTRNRRSVWTVNTKPYKGAHFATFPPELIEPCVLAGAPPGGAVLDPFTGSGTTGFVSKKFGRDFTGIELNPEYLKLAEDRIMSIPEPMHFGEQPCSTSAKPLTKNSKPPEKKSTPVFGTWSGPPLQS